MPHDRIIKGFFFGGNIVDIAEWAADRVGDAKTICNPFGGIGRYASALCHDNTVVDSWDPQILCKLIIDGVYSQETVQTNIDRPRGTKGYMYETRFYKSVPDDCAGLIDWICQNGTMADKFAIGTALPRMTFKGQQGFWSNDNNLTDLWLAFEKHRNMLQNYTSMPGIFTATEGDFFEEDLESMKYDLLMLDPPIIKGSRDIYSGNVQYRHLNILLGGEKELSRWNVATFYGRIRRILSMNVSKFIIKYQTGMNPSLDVFRDILEEYGTITEETVWERKPRTDYTFVLQKRYGVT